MRMLFVNHVHPGTNLVGGLRLYRFAQELVLRGHQVILLCAAAEHHVDSLTGLQSRLAAHDWTTPLILSVRDDTEPAVPARRNGPARYAARAATATRLAVHGGPFWRWRKRALAFQHVLAADFRPQVCYAAFGNLDALGIAREMAQQCGVPWVMDIKDPADRFVPRGLQRWLMSRYTDAAAVTLNSAFQMDHNKGWATGDAEVIYSGVEPRPEVDIGHDPKRVALVGSVYRDEALEVILRGFAAWRRDHCPQATLHYFGVDNARVARVADALAMVEQVAVEPQIARHKLLARCAKMAALIYVRSARTFHHKLLELAALGRPLIACPPEGSEATALAHRYEIDLTSISTVPELTEVLSQVHQRPTAPMRKLQEELSWSALSARLETIFERVAGQTAQKGGAPWV